MMWWWFVYDVAAMTLANARLKVLRAELAKKDAEEDAKVRTASRPSSWCCG